MILFQNNDHLQFFLQKNKAYQKYSFIEFRENVIAVLLICLITSKGTQTSTITRSSLKFYFFMIQDTIQRISYNYTLDKMCGAWDCSLETDFVCHAIT